MLEALSPEVLRNRLHLEVAPDGGPAVGSVANTARACVRAWRSPVRARVTAHLHRLFVAAGFDDELVRARTADVLDALIEVDDLTLVRLSGKASLVLSRRQWVRIAEKDHVLLGQGEITPESNYITDGYVRRAESPQPNARVTDLSTFLGPPGFQRHLARRTAGKGDGVLSEFWATLSATVRHDGQPLDAAQLRAVVDAPGTHDGRFGRYNQTRVSGRWRTDVPDGTWCAVRPGRNPNEWHPILIQVTNDEVQSLDLFDWDEWNWALLARGMAIGSPERAIWAEGTLSFEHPVPAQFRRVLRLIGKPGKWAWTWDMTTSAKAAFSCWQDAII